MATRVCWSCGAHSMMVIAHDPFRSPRTSFYAAAFMCANCGSASLGMARGPAQVNNPSTWLASRPEITWYPDLGQGRSFPHVPDHIAAAASEAHRCHSISAFRAAVLLARSVIEATAKDKGITNGTLHTKIDAMEERDLIRAIVKEAAHEVRLLGNEMAHGDFVDPITPDESSETLELMDMVLNEVYQEPARIDLRKQARLANRATSTS